ncbi:MAG TPA: adenine phosphoribosyltransferase [Thermoguttaceae bacterium]|nr:adenine phosphoribosyltransferase [Thermoguttaceae bacterium]
MRQPLPKGDAMSELKLTDYIRSVPDFPKPGILFRDITPLLAAPAAFRQAVVQLADHYRDTKIDAIAAAEARGFLFAAPLALELDAALIPVRKPGKLPYETLSLTYDLEYGTDTLEIHSDAITPGANVLIVDDLLATGGTIEACCRMVEKAGGKVAGCAFVIELVALEGARRITQHETFSLIRYE